MPELPSPSAVAPPAWSDLIEGLTLLAQHPTDTIRPSPPAQRSVRVTAPADDKAFTDEELARLETFGFNVDSDGGFYSFRYGSA